MEEPLCFTIPQDFPRALRWFTEELQALCERDRPGGHGLALELAGPRIAHLDGPGGGVAVTEIVLLGFRTAGPAAPADWPGVVAGWQEAQEPLGPVIRFWFATLGGETRVWASAAEQPAAVQVVFRECLGQIAARYPAVGPLWQRYGTVRERQRIERIARALAAGPTQAPVAEAPAIQVPGALRNASPAQPRGPYYDARKKMHAMWKKRKDGVRLPFWIAWQDEGLTRETVTRWITKRVAQLWQSRATISWDEFAELWPEHLRDDTYD